MQHWPGFFTTAFSNDAYVEGLGRCVQQGLTKAVGVSNYRKDRIESASARLAVSLRSCWQDFMVKGLWRRA